MAINAQITENNKFTISLQYLKKEVNDEIYLFIFFHGYKHESFLQIDDMTFHGRWSSIHKVPKIKNLEYPCNISRKMGRMNLIFCFQIDIKDFFKLILSF